MYKTNIFIEISYFFYHIQKNSTKSILRIGSIKELKIIFKFSFKAKKTTLKGWLIINVIFLFIVLMQNET
jgi:hypothetical protein